MSATVANLALIFMFFFHLLAPRGGMKVRNFSFQIPRWFDSILPHLAAWEEMRDLELAAGLDHYRIAAQVFESVTITIPVFAHIFLCNLIQTIPRKRPLPT